MAGIKACSEEVLVLISCACKRSCSTSDCDRMAAGLKCTDMCALQYENMANEDEEAANNTGEDDEDEIHRGLPMAKRYKKNKTFYLIL